MNAKHGLFTGIIYNSWKVSIYETCAIIMSIKWQDKVSNNEVLKHSNTSGVEAMIMAAQLRWSEHILRMEDCRLHKKILYVELKGGMQSPCGQKKRFKDNLRQNLKKV